MNEFEEYHPHPTTDMNAGLTPDQKQALADHMSSASEEQAIADASGSDIVRTSQPLPANLVDLGGIAVPAWYAHDWETKK